MSSRFLFPFATSLLCVVGCKTPVAASPQATPEEFLRIDRFPHNWLKNRSSIETAEQLTLGADPIQGQTLITGKPEVWNIFKAQIKANDELWQWESPFEEFGKLRGYCIIRNGSIIKILLISIITGTKCPS